MIYDCFWEQKIACGPNAGGGTDGFEGGGAGDGAQSDGGADETDAGAAPLCEDWDPDSYVWFNRSRGVYEIDSAFVDLVKDAPYLIPECDASRVDVPSGGFFRLVGSSPDDTARHLGFVDGDILKQVNGHRLLLPDDLFDALTAEWNSSRFSVIISRAGRTVTLRYEII